MNIVFLSTFLPCCTQIADGMFLCSVSANRGDNVAFGYQKSSYGNCAKCVENLEIFCPHRDFYGIDEPDVGSMASYIVFRVSFLYQIPSGISNEIAFLFIYRDAIVFDIFDIYNMKPTECLDIVWMSTNSIPRTELTNSETSRQLTTWWSWPVSKFLTRSIYPSCVTRYDISVHRSGWGWSFLDIVYGILEEWISHPDEYHCAESYPTAYVGLCGSPYNSGHRSAEQTGPSRYWTGNDWFAWWKDEVQGDFVCKWLRFKEQGLMCYATTSVVAFFSQWKGRGARRKSSLVLYRRELSQDSGKCKCCGCWQICIFRGGRTSV